MNSSVNGNAKFRNYKEIVRKIVNVWLVKNARDYKKFVSRPSFVSQKIFLKSFVVIHEIKPVLTLGKAIYVGFSILNLSKYLMYEFICIEFI